MSAHTKGPWRACKNGECSCGQVWSLPGDMPVFIVLESGKRQIVGLACNEWGDSPELIYGAIGRAQQQANARLIAAAPLMLETLQGINRALSPGNRTMDEMMRDVGYAVDRARGAIARATET